MPGSTSRSRASMTSCAGGRSAPGAKRATMRPPETAMLPLKEPCPSTIVPSRIRRFSIADSLWISSHALVGSSLRLVGEFEDDVREHARARFCVRRLDVLGFVVADALPAKDEDHPGRADMVEIARVVPGGRRQLHVGELEPLGRIADARAGLRRELQRRIVE